MRFEWDDAKNQENILKHGISFVEAQAAFDDPFRIIMRDEMHSEYEDRWYCIGKNNMSGKILTVRFTMRSDIIRLIGAGNWRKERKYYEKENHRDKNQI